MAVELSLTARRASLGIAFSGTSATDDLDRHQHYYTRCHRHVLEVYGLAGIMKMVYQGEHQGANHGVDTFTGSRP